MKNREVTQCGRVVAILAICGPARAVDSVVTQVLNDWEAVKVLTFTVTTATGGGLTAGHGVISDANLRRLKGMYLYALQTDPGATAPTADYDITVTDPNSLDMCAGKAINRHTSNTEMVYCTSSTQPYSVVRGTTTLVIAAAGDEKQTVVHMIFVK
jgi:hypothetical protein